MGQGGSQETRENCPIGNGAESATRFRLFGKIVDASAPPGARPDRSGVGPCLLRQEVNKGRVGSVRGDCQRCKVGGITATVRQVT